MKNTLNESLKKLLPNTSFKLSPYFSVKQNGNETYVETLEKVDERAVASCIEKINQLQKLLPRAKWTGTIEVKVGHAYRTMDLNDYNVTID